MQTKPDIRDSLDLAIAARQKMLDATTSPTREKRRREFVLHARNVVAFLTKTIEEVTLIEVETSQAERLRVWKLMKEAQKRGADLEAAHYRAEYDRLTNELKAMDEV